MPRKSMPTWMPGPLTEEVGDSDLSLRRHGGDCDQGKVEHEDAHRDDADRGRKQDDAAARQP